MGRLLFLSGTITDDIHALKVTALRFKRELELGLRRLVERVSLLISLLFVPLLVSTRDSGQQSMRHIIWFMELIKIISRSRELILQRSILDMFELQEEEVIVATWTKYIY